MGTASRKAHSMTTSKKEVRFTVSVFNNLVQTGYHTTRKVPSQAGKKKVSERVGRAGMNSSAGGPAYWKRE
jgi:hypothetical protein